MIGIGYEPPFIRKILDKLALICPLERISDPGSYGFSLQLADERVDGFVVRRDGECYAYRNSCPHTGAPLDWVEHQFLDMDQAFIQCAVHDARFTIDEGECVAGPCTGDRLSPLRVISGSLLARNP